MNNYFYDFSFNEVDNPLNFAESQINKLLGVKENVQFLVDSFFAENPEGILFYLCEVSDQREISRKRLFDIWFAANNDYEKQDGVLLDNVKYYFSIIYNIDNPDKGLIEDSFKKDLDIYQSYKE